jgi:hypothetical protein
MSCDDFQRIRDLFDRAEELCARGELERCNSLLENLEIQVRHLHYEVWLANERNKYAAEHSS